MSWPVVPLDDITFLISSGSTPRGGSENYAASGEVMLIRSQNVHMRRLVLDDVAYVDKKVANAMARTYVNRGDVLLNITGASIGRVASFDLDVITNVNQHVCVIRPDPKRLDYRYLTAFLASTAQQTQIMLQQHGGTRQALTFGQIGAFEVPLPPLPEQRRIADILDKADAIRRKRKEAITLTENLLRLAFLDMFGDPVTNPKGWKKETFGAASLEIIDGDRGKAYPGSEEFSPNGHCLFLSAKNVTKAGFEFTECAFISPAKDAQLSKGKLNRNDVVLTTRGTLGNVALYDKNIPFEHVRINSGMVIIRADERRILPGFVYFYLRSGHFYRQIDMVRSGSAQPQLPIRSLNEMEILLPPIAEQRRQLEAFYAIERYRKRLQNVHDESDRLLQSLVHRAFRGELTPKHTAAKKQLDMFDNVDRE